MTSSSQLKPIFVFSLPRSGSTLLQRLIATSEEVHTISEPWILLPLLYLTKEAGVYAEYSHISAYHAYLDLCKELPNGETDYYAAVREAALHIYVRASPESTKYFLDKTPRYTLIIDEIAKTFPGEKSVVIWRNPLSVIASIVETFYENKWKLFHSRTDLFDGMANLIRAQENSSMSILPIRYEDMVNKPQAILKELEEYLGLNYSGIHLEKFMSVNLSGNRGDSSAFGKYRTITTDSVEKWKNVLSNPWRKYRCRSYLRWIGKRRLKVIGYDLDELIKELNGVPTRWSGMMSDMFYSLYGLIYCAFELKILKDKVRTVMKGRIIKKHD